MKDLLAMIPFAFIALGLKMLGYHVRMHKSKDAVMHYHFCRKDETLFRTTNYAEIDARIRHELRLSRTGRVLIWLTNKMTGK